MKRYLGFLGTVFISGILATVLLFTVFLHAQLPAPLGPYANVGFPQFTASTQTPTIAAQQMIGMLQTTFAGATTITTDTAVNLCALFPAYQNQTAGGYAWDWYMKSNAGNTNVVPTGGAGVTVVGLGTTANSTVRHWKIVLDTCPVPGTLLPVAAAHMYSLETTTF